MGRHHSQEPPPFRPHHRRTQSETPVQRKRRLLREFARIALEYAAANQKRAVKYQRLDELAESLLTVLSASTLSGLVLKYLGTSNAVEVFSLAAGSAVFVGQAVKRSLKVTNKWVAAQANTNDWNNMARQITINLTHDNLTSEQLDAILSDVDERMALMISHSSSSVTASVRGVPNVLTSQVDNSPQQLRMQRNLTPPSSDSNQLTPNSPTDSSDKPPSVPSDPRFPLPLPIPKGGGHRRSSQSIPPPGVLIRSFPGEGKEPSSFELIHGRGRPSPDRRRGRSPTPATAATSGR